MGRAGKARLGDRRNSQDQQANCQCAYRECAPKTRRRQSHSSRRHRAARPDYSALEKIALQAFGIYVRSIVIGILACCCILIASSLNARRLQICVGKPEYVRLAAMATALQHFGRLRPLQIVLRVDDAGVDLLSRLQADQGQPASRRVFLHNF